MSQGRWGAGSSTRVGFLVAILAAAVTADDASTTRSATGSAGAIGKPVPETVDDLRAIESQITELVRRVVPCTVGLQIGRAQASGVVISADGYVLTAAHVIGGPGRDVRVHFPDGRIAHGTTLGLTPDVDGGMVRITEPGPWPFAELAPRDHAAQPGEWCLATGHPGGFQHGRTPPVRVGRVIDAERQVLRSDCTISMGDSGGPLFDLQGRVIGIHSRITDDTSMNLHVPVATYHEAWEILKAGDVAAGNISSRFLARLDANGDGKLQRDEIPEGTYRDVFDRMAAKLELDPQQTHDMEELRKSLGLSAKRGFDPRNLPLPTRSAREGVALLRERFAHGRAVRSAMGSLEARDSTVRVKCDGKDIALGTIVAADGWIITKASEVNKPDAITCVLPNRRELTAELVGVDPAVDLALLHIPAGGLRAVEFADRSDLQPGTWLGSVGLAAEPMAVGVVSVAERKIERSPAVMGIVIDDVEGGAAVRQVMPGSGAAGAGIQEGDVITHVAGERVHNVRELQMTVRKHRVGESIKASIERGETKLEVVVRLGMPEDALNTIPASNRTSPVGALSQRRDDFPAVIQHDTVLNPRDCGGPVVDVAGNVIGINIARADRTASYALTGPTIAATFEHLKAARATNQ